MESCDGRGVQFYSAILVVKFLAVLTFSGGTLATLLVGDARRVRPTWS